jgi:hypothetical protein
MPGRSHGGAAPVKRAAAPAVRCGPLDAELRRWDAGALAAAIRNGKLSSREATAGPVRRRSTGA